MSLKKRIFSGDTALWVVFLLMTVVSLLAVYSSIGLYAIVDNGTAPTMLFAKHVGIVVLTYLVSIGFSRINYRVFYKLALWFFLISFALQFFVVVTGGRWLRMGFLSFQPSEIVKITLIVYVASLLTRFRDTIEDPKTLFVLLLPIGLSCALILPENLSTAGIVFLACFVLLYFGGVNARWWRRILFAALAVVVVSLIVFAYIGDQVDVMRSGTWGHRITAWLHPNPDELNQENMSRMAIARGGYWGKGIASTIHARLMTQAHNDFIYSIIIEEYGMLGGIVVFFLYAVFYYRCIKIATRAKGTFGSLCVAGFGSVIFIQALVNMCVAVGVLPVTGQTLPFISYGGTAYVFLGCGYGLIQSVAEDTRRRDQKAKRERAAQDEQVSSEQNREEGK